MVTIGYHCSHERFKPSELLRYIQIAEQASFSGGMCSEHFLPWSEQQGQSGFTWAWLGAALQATDLSFGMVTSPGQRHNPAITAQAIATLAEMFPGLMLLGCYGLVKPLLIVAALLWKMPNCTPFQRNPHLSWAQQSPVKRRSG